MTLWASSFILSFSSSVVAAKANGYKGQQGVHCHRESLKNPQPIYHIWESMLHVKRGL
jgi:hypothetical protein